MRTALDLAFATAILMTIAGGVSAESNSCERPIVEYGSIKRELDSKASFLRTFVGDPAFKGQVEVAKNDILLRNAKTNETRLKQYFLYLVCLQIMNDTKLDTIEKIEAFRDAGAVVFPPKSDDKRAR